MDVRLPDGTVIKGVPDGTTKADLVAKLQANGMAVPAEWMPAAPEKPASVQAGEAIRDVPRQIGLTARYAMEGLPGIVDTLASPFRIAQEKITGQRVPTAGGEGGMASRFADFVGLPKPQTADERVVGDATRAGFGAIGGAGGFARVAPMAQQGGTASNVLQQLAARPGLQAVGAAGGGAAGGSVREAGGDAVDQFGAALLGGVLTGGAAGAVTNVAGRVTNAARAALTPQTVQIRNADQQIELTLRRAGIDWTQVPERIRQGMRQEVAEALNTGQPLNADALRRLLVFRSTNTTPTVGMLTQDPGQITREMNLAKTGANSRSPDLQRLPGIQNANAAALLRQLDEAGAANAPNAHAAGQRAIGALEGNVNAARGEINSLYSAARDTQGRSLPLDGAAWTQRANQLLDEAMVGGALPADVANTMNRVARGEMPLTVEIAEQLKTRIGQLQRGANEGNTRHALGLVRQALDDTPLASPQVNPGNLPAVPGTVPPSPTIAGQQSIDAFNGARAANRQFMNRVEANPALRAVVDGVEPDLFVQRFVIGKGASAGDVSALRQELDPQTIQTLRQYIVRHLRDAATNHTDDITKFSNDAYRRALRDIGDEKLAVFFSPEEVQHLRNVGDAAKYMQAQPAGSAVNNSNSGALVLGRGLDMLEQVAGRIPLVGDTIQGRLQGAMQTQQLAPRNALVQLTQPQATGPRMNPLLAAAVSAPAQARDDDGRQKRAKRDRVNP